MRLLLLIPVAALAAEGAAFWWTHPPATDAAEPVLVWKRGQRSEVRGQKSEMNGASFRRGVVEKSWKN